MPSSTSLRLAVCSSASFYERVILLSYELEKLDIGVVLPKTAAMMKSEGAKNEELADWLGHLGGTARKAQLIRGHFDEISNSDAILVANYEKHGVENYIGPNVLMEMAAAFHLKKPIYVLNDIPEGSPLIDEILGLEPVFLKGDISILGNH